MRHSRGMYKKRSSVTEAHGGAQDAPKTICLLHCEMKCFICIIERALIEQVWYSSQHEASNHRYQYDVEVPVQMFSLPPGGCPSRRELVLLGHHAGSSLSRL